MGFFVRGKVRGHSHSRFSISILHGRWRIRLLGREADEPARRRRSRLGLEPKGSQERIKDGAQWYRAAVVPGTGLWVVGAWVLVGMNSSI